jgi:putative transposase
MHREFYRRHLPHWQPEGATLFITFRLAGSLPQTVIAELLAERERKERALAHIDDTTIRQEKAYLEERRAFGRWDQALHTIHAGPRWLSEPRIAELVAKSLHYRDARVYTLIAFCVMPNHVHLVCTPLPGQNERYRPLSTIMQSLKRYTARESNLALRRGGSFWQEENYDHVVRDADELRRIVWYVIHNPVKAGLVAEWEDWPWTYCASDWFPAR